MRAVPRIVACAKRVCISVKANTWLYEFAVIRSQRFSGPMIHPMRKRWGLPTWNPTMPNPPRGADGTYSVAAPAELLNVYPGTIWLWLRRGVLTGRQLGKGAPRHIDLPEREIVRVRARLARTNEQSLQGDRHHDRFREHCRRRSLTRLLLASAGMIRLQRRSWRVHDRQRHRTPGVTSGTTPQEP